ncbi:MAG: Hydroxylamine reductase [Firmicutes bacterium]|nr:Hydroxylamine reductase [Bacillota bacterium]MBT9163649.1 Hydroxylamine reductase [Chloroflexota bacterium]
MSMFCNQCEQTAKGTGCTIMGVCGKDEDINSLQSTLIYGLKGIAAYDFHARELGYADSEVAAFYSKALFSTVTNVDFDLNRSLDLVLECGKVNLKMMEVLDTAHVARFGAPGPVEVATGTKEGPGILVTGHDLLDLYELLKQTEGTGINIYTHSEMLPAHAYPELRKFRHLVGNYGGAWQKQKQEFADFPGAILANTNCVLIPRKGTYENRLFTCGIAAVAGVTHIEGRDFAPLIQKALSLPMLSERADKALTTGFHHSAVLGLAGQIVDAVKSGKIQHFFLIGGCDGARPGRNYFTELAERVPQDCVILTLACGKYRFNYMDFGSINEIPRLLDLGQCNNAYSAIRVVVALAQAFDCSVNELPLSIVLSWFEQKAVAILITLLHLGIKGIRIGPTLPSFISPNVFQVLQDSFGLKAITTPEEDMKAILGE